MNKKELLYRFIKRIERKKLLTLFLKSILDIKELYDYNYLFRIINKEDKIIIDIYDNITDNRFNRYIYDFKSKSKKKNITYDNNVYITHLNIANIKDSNNKLDKLGYLLKLDDKDMIEYAKTFLDKEIIAVLIDTIKK